MRRVDWSRWNPSHFTTTDMEVPQCADPYLARSPQEKPAMHRLPMRHMIDACATIIKLDQWGLVAAFDRPVRALGTRRKTNELNMPELAHLSVNFYTLKVGAKPFAPIKEKS